MDEVSIAQKRLLDAAVDAFAERGFGGTSTRDIAERAGRSQAALYIHYASKEAVLFEISRRGHLDALACLRCAAGSTEDPAERLRTMVEGFSQWHLDNAKLGRVVQYELHALSEDHKGEIVSLRREFHRVMVDALHTGMDVDVFQVDEVDGTARALLSLCIDLVRWFDLGLSRDPRSVARLHGDLALRMAGAVHSPASAQGADL